MEIGTVVLDGHTLNPGDLSWKLLTDLGPCELYERTAPHETVSRAEKAGAVLTNKVVLDRATLEQLPGLRYIGILATGTNAVDLAAARERGIIVTNVPAYGTPSVTQMTFALLLELTQRVGHHAGSVRAGHWTRSKDFSYWDYPLVELAGLTMGLLGFGGIARGVARVAQAFGMNVVAHRRDRSRPPEVPGVELVDLDTLFSTSDVLSVHCPLTPETHGLIDAARLARMKPSAFLLNTSRGPIVNEADLADALNGGRLAGAGLDVLSTEPPPADHPLLTAQNCLVTPHIAWATRAARARMMGIVVANLRGYLDGQPRNVVS